MKRLTLTDLGVTNKPRDDNQVLCNTKNPVVFYDIEVVHGYLILSHCQQHTAIKTEVNPSRAWVKNFLDHNYTIGFNSIAFDETLLRFYTRGERIKVDGNPMLVTAETLKHVSDDIIQTKSFNERVYDTPQYISNNQLDLYIVQSTCGNPNVSLKKWGAYLNLGVEFGTEYFDLSKEAQDLDKLIAYCEKDVEITRQLWEYSVKYGMVQSYIELQEFIKIETSVSTVRPRINAMSKLFFGGDITEYKSSNLQEYISQCKLRHTPSILENMLALPKSTNKDLEFILSNDRLLERDKGVRAKKYEPKSYSPSQLTAIDAELGDYVLSFGGLHYFNTKKKTCVNILKADVVSMYPNLMINLNLLGTAATNKLRQLLHLRLEAKSNKNIIKSNGLKLLINSIYGITRAKEPSIAGDFYRHGYGVHTTIAGNLVMYDLCLRLTEQGATILQANTDGVMVDSDTISKDLFFQIMADFTERTKLDMEIETDSDYFARDVNNYFTRNTTAGIFRTNKPIKSVEPAVVKIAMNKLLGANLKISFADYLKRNSCNNPSVFSLVEVAEVPRYHKRTGKLLKTSDLKFGTPNTIGNFIQGYMSTTTAIKQVWRYNKTNSTFGKTSGVIQERFKLAHGDTSQFPADLDYQYYQNKANLLIEELLSLD